jgi:hypothetical protein
MSRSAIAIFCDDVRIEATGKRILVGVYQDTLGVPQLPFTISGLNVLVVIRVSADDPIREMVAEFAVPGQELVRLGGEVPPVQAPPQGEAPTKGHTIRTFELWTQLRPFEVVKEEQIVVTVKMDNETIVAGGLDIALKEASSSGARII